MGDPFIFYRVEPLSDGELTLVLDHTISADPARGYVPSYAFTMHTAKGGTQVGRLSLRVGYNENIRFGGHIGYEVFPAYRGRHFALKACRLVLPLARRHGINPLLITCNPDNLASRRTIELLGATLQETVALPPQAELYALGERKKCIFALRL